SAGERLPEWIGRSRFCLSKTPALILRKHFLPQEYRTKLPPTLLAWRTLKSSDHRALGPTRREKLVIWPLSVASSEYAMCSRARFPERMTTCVFRFASWSSATAAIHGPIRTNGRSPLYSHSKAKLRVPLSHSCTLNFRLTKWQRLIGRRRARCTLTNRICVPARFRPV